MKHKIIKLSNGGTLIYEHTKLCDSSAVQVGFKIGANAEKKMGTAHLLEHTLFKKTKNRSNSEVEADRNKITYLNASTSMDYLMVKFYRTNKLLAKSLEFAYDVLMNSVIDDEYFETEKGVVKEELTMCLDSELRDVYIKNFKQVMSKTKTASDIVGKTAANIDKIKFSDLVKFKETHFNGNNFVCSVVSSLSLSKVKSLIEKIFASKIPYNENYKPVLSYYETNLFDGESSLKIYNIKQEKVSFLMTFKIDANELEIFGKNYNYAFITRHICGSQGDLFLKLRNKGLVYSLNSDISCFKENSTLNIMFETSKEKIKEILNIISAEIKNLLTTKIDEEKVKTYKNNLEYFSDEKLPQKPTVKCLVNFNDYLEFGKLFKLTKKEKKNLRDGINAEEIKRLAGEIFNKNNKIYISVLGNVSKSYVPTLDEMKKLFLIKGETYEN